jgi:hypothetical protein
MCHENNWLFKILFKEYLKNEKEYKKNYQTILLTQLVRSTSLHHLGSQKTMVMSTSFGVLCTACQVLPVIPPWAPISNSKDVSLWVLSAACGARRSMAIHSSLRHTRRCRTHLPWLWSCLPVRNSFASYGASAVTRTSDRGHVAEARNQGHRSGGVLSTPFFEFWFCDRMSY